MYTIVKVNNKWRVQKKDGSYVRRKDLTIVEWASAAGLYSFCVYFGIVPVKVKG